MARRSVRRSRKSGAGSGLMAQLQALDAQRKALMDSAKTEAMAAVEMALSALNGLGFNYSVTERKTSRRSAAKPAGRRSNRKVKEADCPVCGFQTKPPHDARSHRSQGATKKPFTPAELEAKGLEKA